MLTRRELLAVASGGITGSVAGCAGAPGVRGGRCEPLARSRSPTVDLSASELPVPRSELVKSVEKDAIRAIVDPAVAPDWDDLDGRAGGDVSGSLAPEDLVLGIERGGRARAYPLQVLWVHEIVNDDVGGPLALTYCPVCGSTVAAERTVAGKIRTFGVSGYLWKSDLVMYDRESDSLWSQIAATAIRGPLVGETLTLVPSTLTTWSEWRRDHPGTDVLLPPPVSGTLGGPSSTSGYLSVDPDQIFRDDGPGGVEKRTTVKGIVVDGSARAYPYPVILEQRAINDRLNGHPVLIALGSGTRIVAYDRCVDGGALTFSPDRDGVARAGGSRWDLDTGLAVDGPHEGTRLRRLDGPPPMFWFAWHDFHPETDVYASV